MPPSLFTIGQIIQPWLDPRVIVRTSPIQGRGMFALQSIRTGEPVLIWGGVIFSGEQLAAGLALPGTAAQIDTDLFLADPAGQPDSPDYCLNHSCDPNLWLVDALTLAARCDIAPSEELTADYATWEADSLWEISACRCGARLCRGKITGRDWMLPELQARYHGHFTPFLNRKIARSG